MFQGQFDLEDQGHQFSNLSETYDQYKVQV